MNLKKYKKHIMASVAVILILIIAFVFGAESKNEQQPIGMFETAETVETQKPAENDEVENKPTEPPADLPVQDTESNIQKNVETLEPKAAEEKEQPVETPAEKKQELKCTVSVRCDTVLNHKSLAEEKAKYVPQNGIIYAEHTVEFEEGETVFDVLYREMKQNGIHMEFKTTPAYNSKYICGINNLYEFDCGELSGWMYRVNDEFPNVGCSQYELKNGDKIEWVYSCELGKDV